MKRRNKKLCVQIARDVLLQLRKKRYVPSLGSYVALLGESYWDLPHEEQTKSFREFFREKEDVTCEVCALGAAFVSLVNIKNKCEVLEVSRGHLMFTKLEEVFGIENMSLIESAYEGGDMTHGGYGSTDEEAVKVFAAIDYGDRYVSSDDRLRAIMKNVIRNGGDFKLPKKLLANVRSQQSY